MKQRIVGTVVLLAVLVVLYVFTGNNKPVNLQDSAPSSTVDSNDRDFKDLKIN